MMTKTINESRLLLSRFNYNFNHELRALLEEKQSLLKGTDLLSLCLFPPRPPEGKCRVRDFVILAHPVNILRLMPPPQTQS